jgi:hypothetical protein
MDGKVRALSVPATLGDYLRAKRAARQVAPQPKPPTNRAHQQALKLAQRKARKSLEEFDGATF